jgi:hypothetical protein
MNREAYLRDYLEDSIKASDRLHYVVWEGEFSAYILDEFGEPVTVIGPRRRPSPQPEPKPKRSRHVDIAIVAHIVVAALCAAAWTILK